MERGQSLPQAETLELKRRGFSSVVFRAGDYSNGIILCTALHVSEDRTQTNPVFLKFAPRRNPESQARLLREAYVFPRARVMSCIAPATCHDLGPQLGLAFSYPERPDMGPIADLYFSSSASSGLGVVGGRVDITRFMGHAIAVCKAIHLLHDNGLVHCCLHPAAVWIAEPNDADIEIIFGDLSRAQSIPSSSSPRTTKSREFFSAGAVDSLSGASETSKGGALAEAPPLVPMVLPGLHYCPPEATTRMRNKTADNRTDLYSLGAILYRTFLAARR